MKRYAILYTILAIISLIGYFEYLRPSEKIELDDALITSHVIDKLTNLKNGNVRSVEVELLLGNWEVFCVFNHYENLMTLENRSFVESLWFKSVKNWSVDDIQFPYEDYWLIVLASTDKLISIKVPQPSLDFSGKATSLQKKACWMRPEVRRLGLEFIASNNVLILRNEADDRR